MKKMISAAVIAVITAASILSGCGKSSLDGYETADPDSTGVDRTEVSAETDETETIASVGDFKWRYDSDGKLWLDAYVGRDSVVAIPSSDPETGTPVTGIDVWAFRDNENVKRVVIPDTVTTIEKNAFMYCSSLESIEFPADLVSIGEQAFYRCSSLKKLSVPEGVETLGWASFMFCEALEEITLPKSLKEIGNSAFSHCDSLTAINFRGSEAEWGKITFSESSMPSTWYTTVFDYAG